MARKMAINQPMSLYRLPQINMQDVRTTHFVTKKGDPSGLVVIQFLFQGFKFSVNL